MHRLLTRQVKRNHLTDPLSESLMPLMGTISDTYTDFENERALIERSLELVSDELNIKNLELKNRLKELEDAHQQLSRSVAVLDGIFNATGEAIYAFDNNGVLIRFNRYAKNILKLKVDDFEYNTQKIILIFYKKLKEPSLFLRELKRLSLDDNVTIFGVLELKNNQLFEYHSTAQMTNGVMTGRVWCLRNVTQIKENEALVQYQAFHDALTNLPNRTLFLDRVNHAIKLSRRNNDYVGILFIDLDHFKKVNDTEGHQVGDELLIDVTKRISGCLREHDTLARVGGDEFIVLLENIKSYQVASHACQRIIEQIKLPFYINNKPFHISTSIGVSMYPRDDTEPSALIRKADMAMYHAKQKGRGSFEFFNCSLERIAHFQLEIENKLRDAIINNELTVYYQPQVDSSNLSIARMEALVRWFPENESPISPAEFIPIAERVGLIDKIGMIVLEKVCFQIAEWISQGISQFCVSVNLSVQQFSDKDLVQKIVKVLEQSGVPGNYLEFEITESMLLNDLEKVTSVLQQLRQLDISVAIDDFGTGYSSLKYLQELPLDIIKIDRSFVSKLLKSSGSQSIVNAIIYLAHSLNLKVVAEGVEDKKVVEYLCEQGCEFIQGFYFYKPMNSKPLTQLLLNK